MGEIISFEEAKTNRLVDKLISSLRLKNEQAQDVANEFYSLVVEDPSSAIENLSKFISKARHVNSNSSLVEAYAGGPNPGWTGPMLDIIGTVYSSFNKETRKEALLECLSFLDGLNYFVSQENVQKINDPWLVSDIIINRHLYWPGYKEYAEILGEENTWGEFLNKTNPLSNDSSFFLALSVMNMKYSSYDIRKKFYEEVPILVDRTQDAIAAFSYNEAADKGNYDQESIKSSAESFFKGHHIDFSLREKIIEKIKEEKWIRLKSSHS